MPGHVVIIVKLRQVPTNYFSDDFMESSSSKRTTMNARMVKGWHIPINVPNFNSESIIVTTLEGGSKYLLLKVKKKQKKYSRSFDWFLKCMHDFHFSSEFYFLIFIIFHKKYIFYRLEILLATVTTHTQLHTNTTGVTCVIFVNG